MVSFTVRMRFESEDRQRVEHLLRELTLASRNEPGCLHYLSHFVEGESATVLLYEQYKDDAALDAHRQTAHFQEFAAGGLFQLMKERHVENLVALL